jgi:hypothetical protein
MVAGSPGTATTSGVVSRSSEIVSIATVLLPVWPAHGPVFSESLDAQRTDAFGRFGLDLDVRFRERCALARLATERPTSGSQRTGWNEMPAQRWALRVPSCALLVREHKSG